jgi:hypothetical protein
MRALLVLAVIIMMITRSFAADADSPEPESLRDTNSLITAAIRCEGIASVTTSEDAKYAALCRASAYLFQLSEPEGAKDASDNAKKGMDLADEARKLRPFRVEAPYRYALCLGIYLRENKLSGLTRVSDLIAAGDRAVALDETYDRGGPHRLLARLYAEAPRFVSVGDRDKARAHLKRLMEIAGEDEENKLTAVIVYMNIAQKDDARLALKKVNPDRVPEGPERADLIKQKRDLERELADD